MIFTHHPCTVTLPVTGVSHCLRDLEQVCCLNCGTHLGMVQPDVQEPGRMIGTSGRCDLWYLVDWHPVSQRGVMILLPEHQELLSSFADDTDCYFYSRRNLTPWCLARQVFACDLRATSLRCR
jgi:hypothetical protein